MAPIPERRRQADNDLLESFGYTVLKALGAGSFGRVYKVKRRDGVEVAAKIIEEEDFNEREVRVAIDLSKLNCPYLATVFGYKQHGTVYVVESAFVNGGCLEEMLDSVGGCIQEQKAKRILRHILMGTKAIHDKNMIHRDIKPDNILVSTDENCQSVVDEGTFMITDFGLTRVLDQNGLAQTKIGPISYISPEFALDDNYDQKADIWSIGCTLYIMLMGRKLFSGNVQQIMREWAKPREDMPHVTAEGNAFFKRLLSIKPEERPTAAQALADPWFTTIAPEVQLPRRIQIGLSELLFHVLMGGLLRDSSDGDSGDGDEDDDEDQDDRQSYRQSTVVPQPSTRPQPAPQVQPTIQRQQPAHNYPTIPRRQQYEPQQRTVRLSYIQQPSTPYSSKPVRVDTTIPFSDAAFCALQAFVGKLSRQPSKLGDVLSVLSLVQKSGVDVWTKKLDEMEKAVQKVDSNGFCILNQRRMKKDELLGLQRETDIDMADIENIVTSVIQPLVSSPDYQQRILSSLPQGQRTESSVLVALSASLGSIVQTAPCGVSILFTEAIRHCPFYKPHDQAQKMIDRVLSLGSNTICLETLTGFLRWKDIRQFTRAEMLCVNRIVAVCQTRLSNILEEEDKAIYQRQKNRISGALYGCLLLALLSKLEFEPRKIAVAQSTAAGQSSVAMIELSPAICLEYLKKGLELLEHTTILSAED
ncbi:putative serine/threonine protein kinase [Blattamonas nauphoetae]|uniref:Serine/threonine protein kinase n=1 Tax=Blattamonas nauphoetae TaxID=2049346 RepID=A0ABQ9X641_9EUKA|nr:putative serine/threonine protein kinase [Blattamonas nauphoetae]